MRKRLRKVNVKKARRITTICLLIFVMFFTIPVNASPKAKEAEDKSPTQFETIILGGDPYGPYAGVTVEYSYGYNFYGKYGRRMPIFAEIKNEGDVDFKGWLEATIPVAEKGQVYRKEVNVKAKEIEKISMTIPLSGGFGEIEVKLNDSVGNDILENRTPIKLGNYEKIIYAGLLTDNPDKLEYLDNLSIKSFIFNEEIFAGDKAYLDSLDIIIINDFDTSVLTDNQVKAIKEWVLDGGTLVFGTGEKAKKVVSSVAGDFSIGVDNESTVGTENNLQFDETHLRFQDANITNHIDENYLEDLKSRIDGFEREREFLRIQIEEQNNYLALYGNPQIPLEDISNEEWLSKHLDEFVNPNVTKTLSNLTFLNYDKADIYSLITSVEGQDKVIYHKKDLGNGNVLIYNFDLSIDEQGARDLTFEAILANSILGNLSENKKRQINNEQTGSAVPYSITNSMSYTDTENIPQVGPYILVLVIYILFIGPVSYLILRRKDKHGLVWIIVPVTALVFTFIIYLMGLSTRVDEPFLGYVEMYTFKDENIVEDDLYFSLTAPHNKNYTVELSGDYENIRLIGNGDEFSTYYKNQTKNYNKKYTASVNYGINETVLEINNNPAFTPVFFEASNEFTGKNPIKADIHYTGDKIEGIITNTSKYTITNGIYIGDTFLFSLGTIYSGQTLDIADVDRFYIHDINDIYGSEVIDTAIYGKRLSDVKVNVTEKDFIQQENINTGDTNRKRELIYALLDKHISTSSNRNCVMGFIEGNEPISFMEEISQKYDVFGTNAILSYVDIDYSKDGALLVPNISQLIEKEEMKYGLGFETYPSTSYPLYITEDEYIETYYLPQDEEIISINYYALSNQKPTSEYNTSFTGQIDVLNLTNGEYDHVFTVNISDNEDRTLVAKNELGKYLSDDNVVTLRYRPSFKQMDSMMLLPNISYWKGGE